MMIDHEKLEIGYGNMWVSEEGQVLIKTPNSDIYIYI